MLIVSIAALLIATILSFILFSSNQNPYNWMGQMFGGDTTYADGMMGGMMGESASVAATNSSVPYFGALFAALIGVTVVSIIGLSYYLVYPQIREGAIIPAPSSALENSNGPKAYESIAKTLTSEERKVINVLSGHNGKYLQKYIKNETGLSRLKTHRILARLSERGIVSLEKTGNTNQVYLANWLND